MGLYAVQLSNGLETYGRNRTHAERLFQECAAEGRCALVSIRKCMRTYLAHSIAREDAPTLGHYERAVLRAQAPSLHPQTQEAA